MAHPSIHPSSVNHSPLIKLTVVLESVPTVTGSNPPWTGQPSITGNIYVHMFGLWEEIGVSEGDPHMDKHTAHHIALRLKADLRQKIFGGCT